jgi:hypothetical protein
MVEEWGLSISQQPKIALAKNDAGASKFGKRRKQWSCNL